MTCQENDGDLQTGLSHLLLAFFHRFAPLFGGSILGRRLEGHLQAGLRRVPRRANHGYGCDDLAAEAALHDPAQRGLRRVVLRWVRRHRGG